MAQNNYIFAEFPDPKELLRWYNSQTEKKVFDVNGHIHTPHSFSAFNDIEQAFQRAKREGISVLGINDFYTTDGYDEFAAHALIYNVFPLFNIEFVVLQSHLQKEGILVNDPNNPGRMYFSGKGLSYPVKMSEMFFSKVNEMKRKSNQQTIRVIEKLNIFFAGKHIGISFDPVDLQKRLSKDLFRERHIAQAIRLALFEKEKTDEGRRALFQAIFSGKELKSPLHSSADIENEIRSNLLKAGGPAFLPEDPGTYISLDEALDIIIDAGGIPCYPALLDNTEGKFTDFENDKEKLLQELINSNIYSIEFIPERNDFKILKDYVAYFRRKGFIITFGTEHNTPKLNPLKISCSGGIPLDEELREVNYEGAAIIAAHQYLYARDEEGYLKGKTAKIEEKEKFLELGRAVISYFHFRFLDPTHSINNF